MSDNNTESDRKLQEIGKQLGTPILSPTTKIETSTDNEPPQQYSQEDLTGTSDSLSRSKNPMLQYLVAGAIGLGVVGVPLSVLFGLGGTNPSQTAVKPTTEVEEEHASLADKELESLKTESALDIQAKAQAQTVAQTAAPKQAAPVQPAQKPQPVAKVATKPKPVPKPTVVPPSPAPVTVPVAKVTPIPVARAVDTPIAQPMKQAIPAPIQVAAKPLESVKPVKPVEPQLSFEQASTLGTVGGESIPVDNGNSNGNGAMALSTGGEANLSPSLALPVGANVLAHTVTPYTAISSRNNANSSTTETPLAVQFDQPIQLAQGFSLPAGTIVQFGAAVADNGAVTATSRGVFSFCQWHRN
jgi:outer membrane biosynthesis protein TonB